MHLLEQNDFESIRLLIINKGKVYFPLIGAVLYKYQKGKVFVDELSKPNIVFVITSFGFAQYFQLTSCSTDEQLVYFIRESNQLPSYFHIYNSMQSLADSLEKLECKTRVRERYQLRYLDKKTKEIKCPYGYQLMNCEDIEFEKHNSFNLDLGNKFWSSSSDFLQKSNGICLVNQELIPVSICYAACIVEGISEIDIATIPSYQHKGLGAIVTQAFVNNAIQKNLQPNWDCFSENTSSLKIAKRIGFREIQKYLLLSVYNEPKNEQERS
jgi:GNAT acetyltransferase